MYNMGGQAQKEPGQGSNWIRSPAVVSLCPSEGMQMSFYLINYTVWILAFPSHQFPFNAVAQAVLLEIILYLRPVKGFNYYTTVEIHGVGL